MAYYLVADIGGTNARFAVTQDDHLALEHIETLHCENFGSPLQAINHYLSQVSLPVKEVCLAVACPVESDRIKLTNNHWQFSKSELAKQLSKPLVVINDFTAAAMATTELEQSDLCWLSTDLAFDKTKQRAIIGPGTGLGMAGIVWCRDRHHVLTTEGGHRSFSPESEIEDYVLSFLREELGVVSCEELLSGRGLVNIYRALCAKASQPVIFNDGKSIGTAALDGDDMAYQTLMLFFSILGSIAGDTALTLGATGGVYIGGGIAPRFTEQLLMSDFRKRFENKLNFHRYLKKIPTAVIMHSHPGLLGAAAFLKNLD